MEDTLVVLYICLLGYNNRQAISLIKAAYLHSSIHLQGTSQDEYITQNPLGINARPFVRFSFFQLPSRWAGSAILAGWLAISRVAMATWCGSMLRPILGSQHVGTLR